MNGLQPAQHTADFPKQAWITVLRAHPTRFDIGRIAWCGALRIALLLAVPAASNTEGSVMAEKQKTSSTQRVEPNASAHPDAIVVAGNARFTVLTPALVRMEWSPAARFEDRASFAFVNRRLPVPKFETRRDDGWRVFDTGELVVRYREDSGAFNADNLRVELTVAGEPVVWKPGTPATGNLLGTARTLDGVSGACPLEPGLLSRDGWTLVDDSQRLLFGDGPKQWATPRPEKDALDWYFFGYGRDYQRQLGDFIKVAGRIPLPPKYAFGAWWSRYWAYTDEELKALVREFDAHDVPLDVLVVDIDWHLDGWTGYTWNPKCFPDPKGFLSWVHEQGLKATLNLHPNQGVKRHEAMFPEFARALGRDPAKVARIPFDCADPRYMKAYFDILHHPKERQGIDFWWIDWQQEKDSKIPGLDPLFWLNHLHWRDMQRNPDRDGARPLIFSRWGGLGNHRYQIGFSGDTFCNWASLAFQPYFTATAGNVGFGYWSHDIGGHQPGPVDPELYTRWVQFGVFSPILRTHTTQNPEAERRIWEFPRPYFEALRAAFQLRYELLPYIYTMARKCHDTGIPLCRPLYYEWPELDEAYNHPGEYLFGDDLLVAPITQPASSITGYAHQKVWLPPGRWINWFTDDIHDGPCTVYVQAGLDEIPLFARAGAIIPTSPRAHRTHQVRDDLLVLHVFPGEFGEFVLYEDDGTSDAYTGAGFTRTPITAEYLGEQYTVTVHPTTGKLAKDAKLRSYELRYHVLYPGLPHEVGAVQINGRNGREAKAPGEAGWWYDTDHMEFAVRTEPCAPTAGCTTMLREVPSYSENPWNARGLRGRVSALVDAERILDDAGAERIELRVAGSLAEWKRGYDKAVTGTLLTSAGLLCRAEESKTTDVIKRTAIARILGLVPHVNVSASPGHANELIADIAVNVTRWANFGEPSYAATTSLIAPAGWTVVSDAKPNRKSAGIGEAIEEHIALRRSGLMQTTILRGDIKIDLPDARPVDFPFSTTLLPSINRWHLLGPFDAPEKDRLQTVHPPETAIDLDAKYVGKDDKPIRWQQIERPVTPESDLTDEFFVEFHKYFGGIKYEAAAYALTYLHAPREMDASLAFGSDDGIVIWLNDREVQRHDVGRAYTPKDDRIPITLQRGANKLLVKISQGGGMWGFGMHVETPEGEPLPEVKVLLSPK